MALQKQYYEIDFGKGIDTKTANELVIEGKFSRLENATRTKLGRIDKNPGYEGMPTDYVQINSSASAFTTVLEEPRGLITFKDSLTAAYNVSEDVPAMASGADLMATFSESLNEWVIKTRGSSVITEQVPADTSPYQFTEVYFDSITVATNNVVVEVAIGGGIFNYRIYDLLSKTTIRLARVSTRTARNYSFRLIRVGTIAYLIWLEAATNNLYVTSIDSATGTTSADILLANNAVAPFILDAVVDPVTSQIYVAYSTAGGVTLNRYSAPANLMAAAIQASQVKVFAALLHLSIGYHADGFDAVVLLVSNGTGATIYNLDRLTLVTAFTNAAFTGGAANVIKVAVGVTYQSPVFTAFISYGDAVSFARRRTEVYNFNVDFTSVQGLNSIRGVTIASKPLSARPGTKGVYVLMRYNGAQPVVGGTTLLSTQNAAFLVSVSTSLTAGGTPDAINYYVHSRILYGDTINYSIDGTKTLPQLSGDASDLGNASSQFKLYCSSTVVEEFTGVSPSRISSSLFIFSVLSQRATQITTETTGNYQQQEIADNLMVNGGNVNMYDGITFSEYGFYTYPEQPILTGGAGGNLTLLGTYQYVLVWFWVDAQGQRHRSAPSLPATVTLAGANRSVTVEVTFLGMTNKGSTDPVTNAPDYSYGYEIYRTETLGTVFYRVSSFGAGSVGTSAFGVLDTTSDADLIQGEVLYTTGGVVESVQPPPTSSVAQFSNRCFALTQDGIYFTTNRVPGFPLRFSDSFVIEVEDRGGPAKALGAIGDKLIIFKPDSIYYTYGEGPNETGAGGSFAEPTILSYDIGCSNPRAIGETSIGLFFVSKKGIYLITPSLEIAYVGEGVEWFTRSFQFDRATVLGSRNEIRFSTSSLEVNTILVFDYLSQNWRVLVEPNLNFRFAINEARDWRGNFVAYSVAEVPVIKEPWSTSLSGYYALPYLRGATSSGSPSAYTFRVVTEWFKFSGVQGFQRVYKLFLTLAYAAPHRLGINLYYDYRLDNADTYNFLFDANGGASTLPNIVNYEINEYAVASNFSSPSAAGKAYQVMLPMPRQKCEAVKIEIYDVVFGAGPLRNSFSITSMGFELGVKGGVYRIPVDQRVRNN